MEQIILYIQVMPAKSREDINKLLQPGQSVTITCSGPSPFTNNTGYIGDVFDDSFEFGVVTNPYEHFSNISDPPILKMHRIMIKDVVDLKT